MADRLAALQGLATQVEGLTGQRYCAGFWLYRSLPSSLLWTAAAPLFPWPAEYRAPSWSWASIDGSVKFNHGRFGGATVIRVLGTQSLSDHPRYHHHRNSQVLGVALHLAGRLLPTILVTSFNGLPISLMKSSTENEVTKSFDPV